MARARRRVHHPGHRCRNLPLTVSHIYTDTLPRMPRTATKRGIVARAGHVERLEAKAKAEKAARQKAERELRVLRRVVFRWEDQPASVCASLKLINHISPK